MSVPSIYSTLTHELLDACHWASGNPRHVLNNDTQVCKNMHMLLLTATKKAEKLNESVNLQELLLKPNTLYLEKSPVLSVLSIENFSESMEGSGCKQMMPKLENKAFSVISTQYIGLKCHKEPYST